MFLKTYFIFELLVHAGFVITGFYPRNSFTPFALPAHCHVPSIQFRTVVD